MSDHGGPVRNLETIDQQIEQAWSLYHRLNHNLNAVEPSEIVEVLRVFDLCLTHAVYLEAIAENLKKAREETFVKENILEISLDENFNVLKNWLPVRPIPHEEMWFEQVWKEYRDLRNNTETQL